MDEHASAQKQELLTLVRYFNDAWKEEEEEEEEEEE